MIDHTLHTCKLCETEVEKSQIEDHLVKKHSVSVRVVCYNLQFAQSLFLVNEPFKPNPNPEVSKLKIFIEVFNALTGNDRKEVSQRSFIEELIRTTKFTEDEARTYIKKAMQNGQIYEIKYGYYVKS